MAVHGEAGDEIGAGCGAERHHQPLALEVSDARLHGTPDWIDGGDVGLEDLDPTANQGGTRPAPLIDRPQPHELPELAEAHREGRLTVDERDVVLVADPVAQADRRQRCRRSRRRARASAPPASVNDSAPPEQSLPAGVPSEPLLRRRKSRRRRGSS